MNKHGNDLKTGYVPFYVIGLALFWRFFAFSTNDIFQTQNKKVLFAHRLIFKLIDRLSQCLSVTVINCSCLNYLVCRVVWRIELRNIQNVPRLSSEQHIPVSAPSLHNSFEHTVHTVTKASSPCIFHYYSLRIFNITFCVYLVSHFIY